MRLVQRIITVCLIQAIATAQVFAANDAGSQQPVPGLGLSPASTPAPKARQSDQGQLNQILNSTVTSAASSAPPVLLPDVGGMPLPGLPPELKDHNKNKTIDLGPLHTGPLIQIASLKPIRMEAQYTQPITLRDALAYVLRNSLPIRINIETWANQRYQWYGSLGAFLPSEATTQLFAHSHVYPRTGVTSRVFDNPASIPVFQGGSVMYSMLYQLYRERAAHAQLNTAINDTLLNTYNAYYNLLLQRALLQIDIKSVEVSQEQLRLNSQLLLAGTGTRFAVMQSRTQLALDRQALLQQQVAVRLASIELAFTLNMPLAVNLVPVESNITESALVDESMGIQDVLSVTLVHRPELSQYMNLRLAAARNIMSQASSLYPTSQFNITPQVSSVSVSGGSGGAGSAGTSLGALNSASTASKTGFSTFGASAPAVGVTTAGVPVFNGTALQITQVAPGTGGLSVTPGTSNTTFGTATAATTTAGNGSTVVTGGSGQLSSTGVNSGTATAVGTSIGSFGGKFNSATLYNNENWTLSNFGVSGGATVLQARAQARQAGLQANQVLQNVGDQIRPSYLNMLAARAQIDVTATGVASGTEELRLANLRLQMGVGTNLELIQAQRDYIQALINQAQAIIASNQAQAQVLHDTGLISFETLTAGYKHPRRRGPSPAF